MWRLVVRLRRYWDRALGVPVSISKRRRQIWGQRSVMCWGIRCAAGSISVAR